MNHLWAVTCHRAEGRKKLLAASELKVKDRRCVVIDPSNQDTRLKLHWVLHHVPDDEVRAAVAPYGKVTEVPRERWRVQGCANMCSTTRSVALKLKAGVTVKDIPHQVRVAGDFALVVVPGRAPLCLRCGGKGHIRRECRVPRCALCRRFGHVENQCAKTYATVTGPVRGEDTSEHLIDVADAEEAAGGAGDEPQEETPPTAPLTKDDADGERGERGRQPKVVEAGTVSVKEGTVSATSSTPVTTTATDEPEITNVANEGTSGAVAKRAREQTADEGHKTGTSSSDEPPLKATPTRRASIKPKPNIPPDRRSSVTLPSQ